MQINVNDLYLAEQKFLQMQRPGSYAAGRSIVTTCYDSEMPSAWVLLNELKRLGCSLPVEVFYRAGELTSKQASLLESVMPGKVQVKTITGNPKDFISVYGHSHGWACKIYALLESSYQENLWIDADNCPIQDPTYLFDDIEYREKGSLFWRDIVSPDVANQYCDNSIMWPIFNIPVNDAEPLESGQLLLNKTKCWLEFALVRYYSDNCEIYYNFGGDKEVFKLAWQKIALLNGRKPLQVNYHSDPAVPYGFIPYGPFHKGAVNQYKKWGGGTVMVQRDRSGRELFNHRNLAKFKIDGNTFMSDIKNESYYHDHINSLKVAYKHG
jgi:alpha 1,2-mannosyltransferase